MRPLKLRSKLALWYALLFLILLGTSALSVFALLELRLRAEADDNLLDHLAGLWGYVHFTDGRPAVVYDPRDESQTYFLREATRYYQIYDATSGDLMLESEDSALMQLSLAPAQVLKLSTHPGIDTLSRSEAPLRFRSAVFRANQHPYVLRVGVSVEQDLESLSDLRTVLLWLVPLTTAIAVFGGWWMAGRVLRPLRDFEREAAAISITHLNRRMPGRGTGDELDSLGATFNQVLAKLDASVRQMRDFAEFMAHELRTPMTVLRGEAQVELMRPDLPAAWRSHLESHLEEFGKLNRLIDRFLLIAKAETGGIQLHCRHIALSEQARELVASLHPLAQSLRIDLTVSGDENLIVLADPEWLERALTNLLDNALKFTPPEGHVRLALRREQRGAVVEVADTGCGIGPEALPRVFDRFYRAESFPSAAGAPGGLGLALTKWIIEQHHGTISVSSAVGKGTTFTVVLPLPPGEPRD